MTGEPRYELTKVGILNRKDDLGYGGNRVSSRSHKWRNYSVVLMEEDADIDIGNVLLRWGKLWRDNWKKLSEGGTVLEGVGRSVWLETGGMELGWPLAPVEGSWGALGGPGPGAGRGSRPESLEGAGGARDKATARKSREFTRAATVHVLRPRRELRGSCGL